MKTILVLASLFILSSFTPPKPNIPKGWFVAGSQPKSYDINFDIDHRMSGTKSVSITSNKSKIKGFGTLMQTCLADEYRGKRVKLSGYLKSENVNDWAGFWMRIDGTDKYSDLGFDNMQDRPIAGTSDWQYCEIVLDVPLESISLNYGALISGTGKIWIDDIKLEIVENGTPVTGSAPLKSPMNLDFED